MFSGGSEVRCLGYRCLVNTQVSSSHSPSLGMVLFLMARMLVPGFQGARWRKGERKGMVGRVLDFSSFTWEEVDCIKTLSVILISVH